MLKSFNIQNILQIYTKSIIIENTIKVISTAIVIFPYNMTKWSSKNHSTTVKSDLQHMGKIETVPCCKNSRSYFYSISKICRKPCNESQNFWIGSKPFNIIL